jgi:hypothetical protein
VPAFGWLAIVELLAVVELLVVVELLEPEWHTALHKSWPWHPFTCIAQNQLVQFEHDPMSKAGVSHTPGRYVKQHAQRVSLVTKTSNTKSMRRVSIFMFVSVAKDYISSSVTYFIYETQEW